MAGECRSAEREMNRDLHAAAHPRRQGSGNARGLFGKLEFGGIDGIIGPENGSVYR